LAKRDPGNDDCEKLPGRVLVSGESIHCSIPVVGSNHMEDDCAMPVRINKHMDDFPVILAQIRIQKKTWIPAFAGMTI
jgi:hypothetical protein